MKQYPKLNIQRSSAMSSMMLCMYTFVSILPQEKQRHLAELNLATSKGDHCPDHSPSVAAASGGARAS